MFDGHRHIGRHVVVFVSIEVVVGHGMNLCDARILDGRFPCELISRVASYAERSA